MLIRFHIATETLCLTGKELPFCIFSKNLWYNQYIQIYREPVHLVKFSDKNINTVLQLYDSNNFRIKTGILKER